MMDKKDIKIEKMSFAFAKEILGLVFSLPQNETRFVLGKQLMRSGTSVGANIEEAQGGLSKAEFIHSMNIAKKEARETLYWLKLLLEFDFIDNNKVRKLIDDCDVLLKMLTAIVKTSQTKK
jgi:four helix bundle protein